jgi:hypothetical protein
MTTATFLLRFPQVLLASASRRMVSKLLRKNSSVSIIRTSRSHLHNPLNLLIIYFIGYTGLKNNQNRINEFKRGAECALHPEQGEFGL